MLRKNRRRYPRVKAPIEVTVTLAEGAEPLVVSATNLSAAGMEVLFPQRVPVLNRVGIDFRLGEDGERILCQGAITRCVQSAGILNQILKRPVDQYLLGISFMDVNEDVGQRLREFVHTHRIK